jgi:two-component system, OmpR family, sensor histidine kinase ChvG
MQGPKLTERLFFSLSTRILAVNILALVMLAGGVLYLDSFRSKLVEQRRAQISDQARLVARVLSQVAPGDQPLLLTRLGRGAGTPRLQLVAADGSLLADTRTPQGPLLVTQPMVRAGRIIWQGMREHSARGLDLLLEWLAGAPRLDAYQAPEPPQVDRLAEVSAESMASLSFRWLCRCSAIRLGRCC